MNRITRRMAMVLAVAPLLGPLTGFAAAADYPVAGMQLTVRERNDKAALTLGLKDAAIPIPGPGTPDDPALAGLTVTLFSRATGETPTYLAPAGTGQNAWKARTTPQAVTHAYRNATATRFGGDIQTVVMRTGAVVKVRSKAAGLALNGPQGAVAVRIEYGSVRVCALFDGASVRKDVVGLFNARNADAADLADCSDETLAAVASPTCGNSAAPECGGTCPAGSACAITEVTSSCTCIAAAQPCGGTAFACNGECPSGEECFVTGLGQCSCLPAGSTACSMDTCGGVCPAGKECNSVSLPIGLSYCECGPPGPCGSGGDDCPPGSFCGFLSGLPMCLPLP